MIADMLLQQANKRKKPWRIRIMNYDLYPIDDGREVHHIIVSISDPDSLSISPNVFAVA